MVRKSFAFLIVSLALVAAGCNTMAGFGRDVEKLGDKIESKAEQKKHY
jgi:predicted small secreted protein